MAAVSLEEWAWPGRFPRRLAGLGRIFRQPRLGPAFTVESRLAKCPGRKTGKTDLEFGRQLAFRLNLDQNGIKKNLTTPNSPGYWSPIGASIAALAAGLKSSGQVTNLGPETLRRALSNFQTSGEPSREQFDPGCDQKR